MSGSKLSVAAISWLFFPGSAAATAMAGSRLKLMWQIVCFAIQRSVVLPLHGGAPTVSKIVLFLLTRKLKNEKKTYSNQSAAANFRSLSYWPQEFKPSGSHMTSSGDEISKKKSSGMSMISGDRLNTI